MFQTYVESRLALWAAQKARREDGGLGMPRKSAFVREISGGFWTPDMDSACYEVDQCVCALIPERREAIEACYETDKRFRFMTIKQKATAMDVHKNTYYNRLELAMKDILGFLNDLAAGIPVTPYTVRTSALNEIKVAEYA